MVLGALLIVICAVAFAVIAGRSDHRSEVLVLARPVTAGQRLDAADVRSVRVSVEAGVVTIPATSLNDVVGQTAAVSLPPGTLLAPAELAAAQVPPGQGIAAVAVHDGQAPPDLAAGEHVLLVPVPASGIADDAAASADAKARAATSSGTSAGGSWPGVVIAVQPAVGAQEATVLSVQLAQADARAVAALPAGQLDVVLVPGS